ncbi:hypothetical protein [Roseateles sp. BYS96W]|uniref:Uncharacterized protein n=1 Tax=Pelomonas nitida TaxID=3299027 RepID=A0ABW7GCT2_9BURK
MLLNLNDPDSIVAWWRVLPDRHDDYLAYKVKVSPEFAPAINEARRRIAANSDLQRHLENAIERRRDHDATMSSRN